MFSLLTSVQEILGYKSKKAQNSRDLCDPKQSLTAIALDLSNQIGWLHPGQMITRELRDSLRSLSQEERTFLVDYPDVCGFTPLTLACNRKLSRVVRYLCRTCLPDLTKRHKWTSPYLNHKRMAPVLWHAAVANHLSTVKVLLKAGADINAVSDTGSTPINCACFNSNRKMVEYLLKAGADVNIPNNDGGTCLMNAIYNEKIVRKLVEHGADIYARDRFQKTVIHYAIEGNRTMVVSYLLKNEINSFQVDVKYHRELIIPAARAGPETFHALKPFLMDVSKELFQDALEILGCSEYCLVEPTFIDTWISVARFRNEHNLSKLIHPSIANFKHRSECVTEQELMKLKTEEDVMYQILMIYLRVVGPYHHYISYALLSSLLEFESSDRVVSNRLGFLLLKIRIENHELFDKYIAETSYALIQHCCEIISTGSPISFEISFGSLKVMTEKVKAYRGGVDQLSESKQNIYDWILNFIVALLYIIKMTVENQQQEIEFFKYVHETLLANGREEEQFRTLKTGYTLVHLAVSRCNLLKRLDGDNIFPNFEVAELLLFCRAPVNAISFDGSSPLFVAAASGNYRKEIVELLLRNGAHCDQVGPGGDTAMEVLGRCLDPSNGDLEPPENLPTVRSLQCLSAHALAKTGVDLHSDYIPPFLRDIVKLHVHNRCVR